MEAVELKPMTTLAHVPRTKPSLVTFLMVMSDILVVVAVMLSSFWIRTLLGARLSSSTYMPLLWFCFLFPMIYAFLGLYPGYGLGPVQELRRLTIGTSLGYLLIAGSSYIFRADFDYSRGLFFIAWVGTVVSLPVSRALMRNKLSRYSWWGEPVVILGAGKTGRLVVDILTRSPGLGFRPVILLDDDPLKQTGQHRHIPIAGGLEVAAAALEVNPIRHAVIAMPGIGPKRLLHIMQRYLRGFQTITIIPELFGLPSLWVTGCDLNGVLGLQVRNRLAERSAQLIKRTLDISLACVLVILLLPLFILIAMAIKLDSPGPVFYRHQRIGKGMRTFEALKFRTMVKNADKILARYLEQNPELREEWEKDQKLKYDPRVTRVGRVLRKLSLDELPQLFNVIRGEMSLVGPRPIVKDEIRHYGDAFELYTEVYPGITGLWQVSGRNDVSYDERVRLDSYYVRNWSVWLDLYVLARTVPAVLIGKGAY